MIEQSAKVISCNEETVSLEVERESTCSACKVRQGCGTAMLAEHVGKRFSHITVPKTGDVNVGQQVQLAIPEETLLQGAFLMYIMPIVLLFVFSAIAQQFTNNAFIEIISGLTGLALGFYLVKIRLKNKEAGFQARIIEDKK
ncbi:MAG: SoxR reducing system RseC family protein [Piscirickettsiaceae bacterium]|nr:SoxR reducing system RseC family protein [Piscirickettsiaceae bacterium]